MSDASVLKEQQLCNYSRLVADLQARRWEAPKLRIANLSRDIVCLLTQGRTLVSLNTDKRMRGLAFSSSTTGSHYT
jgi:hypothetical protein